MRTVIVLSLISALALLPSKGTAEYRCHVTEFNKVPGAVRNCKHLILDSIQVPAGETLKLDRLIDGASVTFRGETVFGYAKWHGPLVAINGTDVVIKGEHGSVLNGRGELYWDGKGEWGTNLKPRFFIMQLHNSTMKHIKILNAPIHCVALFDSADVSFSHWVIDNSAGDPAVVGTNKSGHNTDGFGIRNSKNIAIKNCKVFNQDDCVAVNSGDKISVRNMLCVGGHGLSLSVGFSNDSVALNTLTNVLIADSVLKGGENGIHIKNHVDAGVGAITNVTYKNIVFSDIENYGINIQQNYKNHPANSSLPTVPTNNIPFKHFIFKNITGSVVESTAVPIYINCAEDGCFDWRFSDVAVAGNGSANFCNFVPPKFSC